MTPENKIKREIIRRMIADEEADKDTPLTTDDEVDSAYSFLTESTEVYDYESELRGGQVNTGLACESSRHYESQSVAMQCEDGSWVGWTYWYGGGKHGEPGAIEWMEDAYDLACIEEEKVVTVRTFVKVED